MADNTSSGIVTGSASTTGVDGAARLAMSGLVSGAENALKDIAGRVFNVDFRNSSGTSIDTTQDWRVRISVQPATANNLFYNNGSAGPSPNPLLAPLARTNGVVFPYTPSITIGHTARYSSAQLTHSNYASYFYDGSEVQNITLNGTFTVQDVVEGQYLMAAIQFFRSCTKMFFGNDPLAGTPPPMVFLDGYGAVYLPHVPCVITQFSHTMPEDVDYVETPIVTNQLNYDPTGFTSTSPYNNYVRLPVMSTINLTLQPIYSRKNIAQNFTLKNYISGALAKGPTSDTGGFL